MKMKRIIALILTLTFLSQDIVWAYPDQFSKTSCSSSSRENRDCPAGGNLTQVGTVPIFPRSNLAPQSLFINPADDFCAASLYREITETSEKLGIPLDKLDLGAVRAILEKHKGQSWFKFTNPRAGEILVTFERSNMLRFYDPQVKIGTIPEGDCPYFSNKIISELQMPPGSRFGIQYLKVEALPPPSSVAQEPGVAEAVPVEPSSETFIGKHRSAFEKGDGSILDEKGSIPAGIAAALLPLALIGLFVFYNYPAVCAYLSDVLNWLVDNGISGLHPQIGNNILTALISIPILAAAFSSGKQPQNSEKNPPESAKPADGKESKSSPSTGKDKDAAGAPLAEAPKTQPRITLGMEMSRILARTAFPGTTTAGQRPPILFYPGSPLNHLVKAFTEAGDFRIVRPAPNEMILGDVLYGEARYRGIGIGMVTHSAGAKLLLSSVLPKARNEGLPIVILAAGHDTDDENQDGLHAPTAPWETKPFHDSDLGVGEAMRIPVFRLRGRGDQERCDQLAEVFQRAVVTALRDRTPVLVEVEPGIAESMTMPASSLIMPAILELEAKDCLALTQMARRFVTQFTSSRRPALHVGEGITPDLIPLVEAVIRQTGIYTTVTWGAAGLLRPLPSFGGTYAGELFKNELPMTKEYMENADFVLRLGNRRVPTLFETGVGTRKFPENTLSLEPSDKYRQGQHFKYFLEKVLEFVKEENVRRRNVLWRYSMAAQVLAEKDQPDPNAAPARSTLHYILSRFNREASRNLIYICDPHTGWFPVQCTYAEWPQYADSNWNYGDLGSSPGMAFAAAMVTNRLPVVVIGDGGYEQRGEVILSSFVRSGLDTVILVFINRDLAMGKPAGISPQTQAALYDVTLSEKDILRTARSKGALPYVAKTNSELLQLLRQTTRQHGVHVIAVRTDPLTDTPAALKTYVELRKRRGAERFSAAAAGQVGITPETGVEPDFGDTTLSRNPVGEAREGSDAVDPNNSGRNDDVALGGQPVSYWVDRAREAASETLKQLVSDLKLDVMACSDSATIAEIRNAMPSELLGEFDRMLGESGTLVATTSAPAAETPTPQPGTAAEQVSAAKNGGVSPSHTSLLNGKMTLAPFASKGQSDIAESAAAESGAAAQATFAPAAPAPEPQPADEVTEGDRSEPSSLEGDYKVVHGARMAIPVDAEKVKAVFLGETVERKAYAIKRLAMETAGIRTVLREMSSRQRFLDPDYLYWIDRQAEPLFMFNLRNRFLHFERDGRGYTFRLQINPDDRDIDFRHLFSIDMVGIDTNRKLTIGDLYEEFGLSEVSHYPNNYEKKEGFYYDATQAVIRLIGEIPGLSRWSKINYSAGGQWESSATRIHLEDPDALDGLSLVFGAHIHPPGISCVISEGDVSMIRGQQTPEIIITAGQYHGLIWAPKLETEPGPIYDEITRTLLENSGFGYIRDFYFLNIDLDEEAAAAGARLTGFEISMGGKGVSKGAILGSATQDAPSSEGAPIAGTSAAEAPKQRPAGLPVEENGLHDRLSSDQQAAIARVNIDNTPEAAEILAAFLSGVSQETTISCLAAHLQKSRPESTDWDAAHAEATDIVRRLTAPQAMAKKPEPKGEGEAARPTAPDVFQDRTSTKPLAKPSAGFYEAIYQLGLIPCANDQERQAWEQEYARLCDEFGTYQKRRGRAMTAEYIDSSYKRLIQSFEEQIVTLDLHCPENSIIPWIPTDPFGAKALLIVLDEIGQRPVEVIRVLKEIRSQNAAELLTDMAEEDHGKTTPAEIFHIADWGVLSLEDRIKMALIAMLYLREKYAYEEADDVVQFLEDVAQLKPQELNLFRTDVINARDQRRRWVLWRFMSNYPYAKSVRMYRGATRFDIRADDLFLEDPTHFTPNRSYAQNSYVGNVIGVEAPISSILEYRAWIEQAETVSWQWEFILAEGDYKVVLGAPAAEVPALQQSTGANPGAPQAEHIGTGLGLPREPSPGATGTITEVALKEPSPQTAKLRVQVELFDGIHIRPAVIISNYANKLRERFNIKIKIQRVDDGYIEEVTDVFGLLSLGIKCKTEIDLIAEGHFSTKTLMITLDFIKKICESKNIPYVYLEYIERGVDKYIDFIGSVKDNSQKDKRDGPPPGHHGFAKRVEITGAIPEGATPAVAAEEREIASSRPELEQEAGLTMTTGSPSATLDDAGEVAAKTQPAMEPADTIRDMICEADRRFRENIAAKPLPSDAQILLSEGLFDIADAAHLKENVFKDNKIIAIATFDDITEAATKGEDRKGKVACVMTRLEFERLSKIKGFDRNKERLKATILVLDEKLEGANYLYLEGVVGLVKAMMDKDVSRIRMCMKFLFEDFEADDATLTDPLKLVLYALKFRPITQANIKEVIDRYKRMVEDALIAA